MAFLDGLPYFGENGDRGRSRQAISDQDLEDNLDEEDA